MSLLKKKASHLVFNYYIASCLYVLLGVYDARMRVFVLYTAQQLQVSPALLEMYENSVVQFLSRDGVQHSELVFTRTKTSCFVPI